MVSPDTPPLFQRSEIVHALSQLLETRDATDLANEIWRTATADPSHGDRPFSAHERVAGGMTDDVSSSLSGVPSLGSWSSDTLALLYLVEETRPRVQAYLDAQWARSEHEVATTERSDFMFRVAELAEAIRRRGEE